MPHLLILMTMRHASLHVLLQGWRLTKECPLVFFYIAGGIFGKSETGGSLTQYKGMSFRSRYQQRRRSSCIVKLSVEFPISFKCLCFFFHAYAFSALCMSCLSAGRLILYLGGSRSWAFARCLRFSPGSRRLQGQLSTLARASELAAAEQAFWCSWSLSLFSFLVMCLVCFVSPVCSCL
jgi:hypothetical protein